MEAVIELLSNRVELLPFPPMKIGQFVIDPPLCLAPMAGHTHHAFRSLVRQLGGCGLVCTELLSSHALQHKGSRERTLSLFDWTADETPCAVQLFGNDPGEMAEAARVVADHGASIVDINMGCWVPKIAKKGGGAALLRDVCTAQKVVEAVVKAVDVPVTVKVRTGFEEGQPSAVVFARAAHEAGAQAIAVHARYASQGFSGHADWGIIQAVKDSVPTLPIIGNGDVFTANDARRMFTATACDGVMLGRAVLGAPWIFQQIHDELRGLPPTPYPRARRAQIALEHAHRTLHASTLSEERTVLELRGQLSLYGLDCPESNLIRNQLVRCTRLHEIEALLLPIIEECL